MIHSLVSIRFLRKLVLKAAGIRVFRGKQEQIETWPTEKEITPLRLSSNFEHPIEVNAEIRHVQLQQNYQ